MAAYTIKRLLWLGLTLLFISLVTFVLMHSVKGGPWDTENRSVPQQQIENLNRKYGLNEPLWRQYALFLENAVQGDLGLSFQRQDRPVTEIILNGFKVTAVLGLLAFALAASVGVTLGVYSALHRNRLPDYGSVFFATLGAAIPAFVLGILLKTVFAVELGWFATFGWNTRDGLIPGWLPRWDQLVLPVVTLAALPAAYIARITRASLLDVLRQDYMRTARAKGLANRTILFRHGLRNAAIPILTVSGPILAALVTGSFIVEQVFEVPGVGRDFVDSVSDRDYGMIMGTTLFYAFVVVIANLIVDISYAWVDPRVRLR
ncbi:MAG TPA: ABC transporter permease [Dehalococcoidia bacterium]|nr:ABC transporter permease [Dehalococcoidia bacterium]